MSTGEYLTIWFDGRRHQAKSGDVIGRDETADIAIGHDQVSRRHAELCFSEGVWSVSDLGSTNGLDQGQGRVDLIHLLPGANQVWLGPPDSSPSISIELPELPTDKPAPQSPQVTPPPLPATTPTPRQAAPVPAPLQPQQLTPPPTPRHVPPPPPIQQLKPPGPQAMLADQQMAQNLGSRTGVLRPDIATDLTIGRSPDCDICLADPLVSRNHARLRLTPAGGEITDLGTINGTYVNGQRIRSTAVNNGDVIEIGKVQFVVDEGKLEQHIAYGLPLIADDLSVVVGDGLKILQNVSFTLPAGSMTAVVGPSGSGKTTLLNALTGRRPADTGKVYLGGRDLYQAKDSLGRSIGFVPQDDPVHESLKVRRALSCAAKLRLPPDSSKSEIAEDVDRVATELGLAERLDTQIRRLSGGQKKRVSVGYELVGEPQALILDEPTSGLDPGLERELMNNLRELATKGTTTIVVTHSVQSVELCDQVVVLAPGGKLAFIGKPERVAGHFNCGSIAEVFTLLSDRPDEEWANNFAASSSFQQFVSNPPRRGQQEAVSPPRRSFLKDLRVLTGRYISSLLGEKKRLGLMFLQAPILGLVLALVLQRNAFTPSVTGLNIATYYYVLANILIMSWLGGTSSVRELVDERSAFIREQAVGVSSTAFVLSKWVVLAGAALIQAISLHLIASSRQLDRPVQGVLISSGDIEFILALAGIGLASVGVGLVISSLVKDTARALVILPLALVIAVLFSGLFIPTDGQPGLEQASLANPIQWGGAAGSTTVDLLKSNNCLSKEENPDQLTDQQLDDLLDGLELDDDLRARGEIIRNDIDSAQRGSLNCSQRWIRTTSNQILNFSMLALLSVIMLMAAGFATHWSLSKPQNR